MQVILASAIVLVAFASGIYMGLTIPLLDDADWDYRSCGHD